MPYVQCERCGVQISISKIDFANGKYTRLCHKCLTKPKRDGEMFPRSKKEKFRPYGGETKEVSGDIVEQPKDDVDMP